MLLWIIWFVPYFVAAAPENQLFTAGRSYTYAVTGDAFMSPPWSPNRDTKGKVTSMNYFMRVESFEPNKIILQPSNYRIFDNSTNKEVVVNAKVKANLESPIEVTMDPEGQPSSMVLQQNLSAWAMSMKKSQVSRFLLNTGPPAWNPAPDQYYSVEERSILGYCETHYDMRQGRLPSRDKKRHVDLRQPWAAQKRHWDDWVNEGHAQVAEGYQNGISNGWGSGIVEEPHFEHYDEDDSYYQEMFRYCDPDAKLYEFRKIAEPRNCRNDYPVMAEGGHSATQYLACGPNRKNLTILEISHLQSVEGLTRAQTMLLVDVGSINSHAALNLPGLVTKVTNMAYAPLKEETQDVTRDMAFRACLELHDVNSLKLVSRDLNSTYYNRLNRPWNLRKEKAYPRAYFLPTTSNDVAAAVKCGLTTRIRLVPNSGGHSYEGISWGSNDTIIVDFRNMRAMSIDTSGTTAVGYLEPGALLGHVNAYFWENGGYFYPVGQCLTVGVGGHLIGGGVGYFSALYGLATDHVLELEVVDGRGYVVVANATENPDLFWALRGGGPGYIGIVTRFKVRLFDAQRINITIVLMNFSVRDFAQAYVSYQNTLKWIEANEPTISFSFSLTSDNYTGIQPQLVPPGIEFTAVHIQDPVFQPRSNVLFLETITTLFPTPATMIVANPNYIHFVDIVGYAPLVVNGMMLPSPPHPTLMRTDAERIAFMKSLRKEDISPRYFKAKSFFIRKYFSLAEMDRVAQVMQRIPNRDFYILCNTEQGAIQDLSKNDTAYVHRDVLSDITLHYEGSPDPGMVQEGLSFLYDLFDSMKFMDGGETYQNFPDFDLKDMLVRNYGENLDRLIVQKSKWDPKNYFVSNISLPVIG